MYKLYYTLPSSKQFLSVADSINLSDLFRLPEYVALLRDREDVVYVYESQTTNRMQLRSTCEDSIEIIIDVPSEACGYLKVMINSELLSTVGAIEQAIKNPAIANFSRIDW